MFPGQLPPAPQVRVWSAVYMDDKTECVEICSMVPEDNVERNPLYHREASVGTAVADFLVADLSVWERHRIEIRDQMNQPDDEKRSKRALAKLLDLTRYWLRQSGLFAPFAAAIQRLHLTSTDNLKLALESMDGMMDYYRGLQPKLCDLVYRFFEAEEPQNMAERFFAQQEAPDCPEYPALSFGPVSFCKVYKGVVGIYLFDEQLNDPIKVDPVYFTTEVLETEKAEDFVHFVLCRYIQENVRLRVCKYCGRYFGITGNSKYEYCERPIDGSTKTCREAGALRLYERRKMEEPAIKEYKRSYKAHNARIRYGIMTREEFNEWSIQAREKRDLCLAGKLSLEDFVAWLDSDKQ